MSRPSNASDPHRDVADTVVTSILSAPSAGSGVSSTLVRCCRRCGGPLPIGSDETRDLCAICSQVDALVTTLTTPMSHEQVAALVADFTHRGLTYAVCDTCGTPVPRVSGPVLCADCVTAEALRSRPLSDEVELARVLASQGLVPDANEAAVDATRVALGWPSRAMCQVLGVTGSVAEQLAVHSWCGDDSRLPRNRKAFGNCYADLVSAPSGLVGRPPNWVGPIPPASSDSQAFIQWRAWHAQAPGYLLRLWYDPTTEHEQRMRYGAAEPQEERAVESYLAMVRAGGIVPLGAPAGGERPPRDVFLARYRAAYVACQQGNLQGPVRRRPRPRQEDVAERLDIPVGTFRRWRQHYGIPYPPPLE